jgi:hypothetical protein
MTSNGELMKGGPHTAIYENGFEFIDAKFGSWVKMLKIFKTWKGSSKSRTQKQPQTIAMSSMCIPHLSLPVPATRFLASNLFKFIASLIRSFLLINQCKRPLLLVRNHPLISGKTKRSRIDSHEFADISTSQTVDEE